MADLASSYLQGVRSGEGIADVGISAFEKARSYRDRLSTQAYQHETAAKALQIEADRYDAKVKKEKEGTDYKVGQDKIKNDIDNKKADAYVLEESALATQHKSEAAWYADRHTSGGSSGGHMLTPNEDIHQRNMDEKKALEHYNYLATNPDASDPGEISLAKAAWESAKVKTQVTTDNYRKAKGGIAPTATAASAIPPGWKPRIGKKNGKNVKETSYGVWVDENGQAVQ